MNARIISKWKVRAVRTASLAVVFLAATTALGQNRNNPRITTDLQSRSIRSEQRLTPPPRPQNNQTYDPTADILRGIFQGIDTAARNSQNNRPQPQIQPQNQQYRSQNQPYRQQNSTNYRPQTITLPRNVQTVRNELPAAQSFSNVNPFADAKFGLISPDQAQQLIVGANKDILTELDNNREFQDRNTDEYLGKLFPDMSPEDRKALGDAVKAGDAEKVSSLWPPKIALDPSYYGKVRNITQLYSEINELDRAVRQGKRADEIAPFIEKVKKANLLVSPSETTNGNALRFDSILRQAKQRDALFDAFAQGGSLVSPNGGLPMGQTSVLFFPNMPSGIVMVAGDVFVTGGPMEMRPITTAQVLGLPVGTSAPLAEGTGDPSVGLTLVNPKKNGTPFNYNLDDRPMNLASGQAASFTDGPEWIVTFDRGEGNSTARHKVVAGSYQFTATGGSWDLTKQTYETTIDNSANKNAFHYVIHSEPAIVEPHSSRTHTSDYPPVIKFDTGTGQDRIKKVTEAKATYRVGIDSSSNMWDLFDSVAPGGLQSNALAVAKPSVTPVTSLDLGAGLSTQVQP